MIKNINYYLFFIYIECIFSNDLASDYGPKEYCELDTFKSACSQNSVVLITQALYGRMKIGNCVTSDFGFLGCQTDVTLYMNGKCGGRRSCELNQPDRFLKEINSCNKDLTAFLQVSYQCIKVEKEACRRCLGDSRQAMITSERGYIGSIVSKETQIEGACGLIQCPYVITALPGQIINVSIIEFSNAPQYSNSRGIDSCNKLAVLKEGANPREVVFCSGGRNPYYVSLSNVLTLQVISQDPLTNFIIHHQALGCPDVDPPKFGWIKRSDNALEVWCDNEELGEEGISRWSLTCVGTKWEGTVGTCDQPEGFPRHASVLAKYISSQPFGLILTAVVGIAIVLVGVILGFGILCYRRSQKSKVKVPALPSSEQYADLGEIDAAKQIAYKNDKSNPIHSNQYANHQPLQRPLPSIPSHMQRSFGPPTDRHPTEHEYFLIDPNTYDETTMPDNLYQGRNVQYPAQTNPIYTGAGEMTQQSTPSATVPPTQSNYGQYVGTGINNHPNYNTQYAPQAQMNSLFPNQKIYENNVRLNNIQRDIPCDMTMKGGNRHL